MIYLLAGGILLSIEGLMLSILMSYKQKIRNWENREPYWWEQLIVLYHLPIIALLAFMNDEDSGPYWIVAVLTFLFYLGITVLVVVLGVNYLGWKVPLTLPHVTVG